MAYTFLLCLAAFSAVAYCQTGNYVTEIYCKRLKTEDCNSHPVAQRCGDDQVTYRNRCELGKSFCANDTHQAHEGPCTDDPHATRGPEEVKHGAEVIYEFECARLSHRPCEPAINEKVCGTDGYTYPSFCEYSKSRCTHRDLHVVNMGDCHS